MAEHKHKREDTELIAKALKNMRFGEYVNFIKSPWRAFFFGFLKGTGTGLGLLVGAALVIAFLSYIINLLGGVPIIGDWVEGLGRIIGGK